MRAAIFAPMLRLLWLTLLITAASPAAACGYCIEDKIAAVYDHAVVSRALAQQHRMVFFAIDGPLPLGDASRRTIEALAGSAFGVDKGSVRVSLDAGSLSIAFDPARVSYAAVERILGRKLAAKQLLLLPLRIMDKPADFSRVSR